MRRDLEYKNEIIILEGLIAFQKRDLQGAIIRFEQAMKNNPSHNMVQIYYCQALLAVGRYKEAKGVLSRLRNSFKGALFFALQ